MTIASIKDLSKIIDLCRKKGIDHIKIDGIELKLGHLEHKLTKPELVQPIILENQFSEEDILNWSVPAIDGAS